MATPTAQTVTVTPATTTYPIGAVVQVATLFATDGVAVDPTAVLFSYMPVALGTATTLTYGTDAALVKDSTGNYHVNLDTTSYGGQWNWRFFSTGTGQSSIESSFYVRPNAAVTTTSTPTPNTVTSGTGTPQGAVTAPIGSVYLNLSGGSGTTLYVKESGTGNTGWVGK